MNKSYICKGCGETLSIKTMSTIKNYCNDCHNFYKNIMKNS